MLTGQGKELDRKSNQEGVELAQEILTSFTPDVTKLFLDRIESTTGVRDEKLLPAVLLEYAKAHVVPDEHAELARTQSEEPDKFSKMITTMVLNDSVKRS